MDRKTGAALAVALLGVIVGVVGIVMAKDAKDANKDTQVELEQQIKQNDRSSAARVTAAAAAAKLVEKRIQGKASAAEKRDEESLDAAEKKDSSEVSANASGIQTLNDKVTQLSQEIGDVEGKQKSNTAKVNARIDQLAARINSGG